MLLLYWVINPHAILIHDWRGRLFVWCRGRRGCRGRRSIVMKRIWEIPAGFHQVHGVLTESLIGAGVILITCTVGDCGSIKSLCRNQSGHFLWINKLLVSLASVRGIYAHNISPICHDKLPNNLFLKKQKFYWTIKNKLSITKLPLDLITVPLKGLR